MMNEEVEKLPHHLKSSFRILSRAIKVYKEDQSYRSTLCSVIGNTFLLFNSEKICGLNNCLSKFLEEKLGDL
jgi:hypothetical protein